MRKRQHRVFYLSRCAVCIALGSTFAHVAWARDYFNPAFIENHGQASRTSVDLSTFDNDKSQLPGTYYVHSSDGMSKNDNVSLKMLF